MRAWMDGRTLVLEFTPEDDWRGVVVDGVMRVEVGALTRDAAAGLRRVLMTVAAGWPPAAMRPRDRRPATPARLEGDDDEKGVAAWQDPTGRI